MRFTRKQRLGSQAEFRFVFSRPKASKDQYFRVLARENSREFCRLGMAVSRKTCKKAVQRNRLKRVIRESFSHHCEQMAAGGGFDLVVLPTAQAASICNKKLAESLQEHWLKAQGMTSGPATTNNRNKLDG